jgi:predicted ribosome quality control (RQC) complex YloA/Tae2 family protein
MTSLISEAKILFTTYIDIKESMDEISKEINKLDEKSNSLEKKSNELEKKSNELEKKSNELEKKSNKINEKIINVDKEIESDKKNLQLTDVSLKKIESKKIEILNEMEKKADEMIEKGQEKVKNAQEKIKNADEKLKNIEKQEALILKERTVCSGAFFKSIGQNPLKEVSDIESFSKGHFPKSDLCRTKIESKLVFKLKSFTPYEKFIANNTNVVKKIDFSQFVGGFPTDVDTLIKLLKTAISIKEIILPSNIPLESKQVLNEVTKIRTDLKIY